MPNWKPLSDEELDAQIEQARTVSRAARQIEPYAIAARYDRPSQKFVVELNNDTSFIFPAYLCEGLSEASDEQRAAVMLTPSGMALMWDDLDVGLTLPGLMKGIFGTRAWMAELGKKGGSKTSATKAKSSRENGKKGGRPRKSASS